MGGHAFPHARTAQVTSGEDQKHFSGCLLRAEIAVLGAHRHGDKAAEMQLVEFKKYVEAAEKLINENPLGLKRVALVSSEDPWVIEEASRLTRLDIGMRCPHETPVSTVRGHDPAALRAVRLC